MPGKEKKQQTQIIGLRLSPALVREVRQEAARRDLRLNQLFVEIWTLYKTTKKGS